MSIKKKIFGVKEFKKKFGELTFATLLESHRLCEELSQKEFSRILGISPSSLCDMEKGRKIPSPIRAFKIASLLGVSKRLWVEIALQDQLKKEGLDDLKVSVA